MSGPNINDPIYSTLNTYAVLASSGITTNNTTTITNGNYGSVPIAPQLTGINGTLDQLNASTANSQLTDLTGDIDSYRATLGPETPIPGADINNVVTLFPNVNYEDAGITFSGVSIVLDATGFVGTPQFFITSTFDITFNNVSSITLINASTCNVFWLASSKIEFTGTSPDSIPGIFIAGTSITIDNPSITTGRIYANTGNVAFNAFNVPVTGSSVDGACLFVCYLKGTKILTNQGYVLIEHLKVGDKVVTKGKIHDNSYLKLDNNYSLETITWIDSFKTKIFNKDSLPICIKANALGINSPNEDLYVSPGHRIIIDSEMICARDLINGTTIFQDNNCRSIHYYHLELKDHASIIANGVISESYLDFNTKYLFGNSKIVNEVVLPNLVLA